MKQKLVVTISAVAIATGAMIALPSLAAAQAPPMGGGFTHAIAIPVFDPSVKAIAGALFEPVGRGPFPAVIYMADCDGVNPLWARDRQASLIDHLVSKNVAVLILDSLTPRREYQGWCDRISQFTLFLREAEDAHAAMKVLAARPRVDSKRIFLQGYGSGANSATLAVAPIVAGKYEVKFAGVIAWSPYCVDDMNFSVPTLMFAGAKDDFAPAKLCEKIKDRLNLELVVYPDATHNFDLTEAGDFDGHHMAYDMAATDDAQKRVDAFMATHMWPPI